MKKRQFVIVVFVNVFYFIDILILFQKISVGHPEKTFLELPVLVSV